MTFATHHPPKTAPCLGCEKMVEAEFDYCIDCQRAQRIDDYLAVYRCDVCEIELHPDNPTGLCVKCSGLA